jgi:tRNA A-37 threonylcarbamoyl transferase component Bud32
MTCFQPENNHGNVMVHDRSDNLKRSDSVPAQPCDSPECFLALSEDELLRRGRLLHAAGSVANADIYLLEGAGAPVVLKTFHRRPWLVRLCFSRWTLAHEYSILRRLSGIPGIPAAWGRVGKDSFLLEYVQGAGPLRNRRELAPADYPPKPFFVRLRDLVAAMHARGVGHGDLRRLNIMQGPDDTPYLIDFAPAVAAAGLRAPLRRRIVAVMVTIDYLATAKIIASYYPELLTDTERQRLEDIPWHLRLGRFLRKRIYGRFIKQKHWRQRWAKWRGTRM